MSPTRGRPRDDALAPRCSEELERSRLGRVAAEQAHSLEVREVRVHGGRRGQADLFANLPDRRRIPVGVDVLDEKVPDLLLSTGQHAFASLSNVCSTEA
jgi:hypothetical protein